MTVVYCSSCCLIAISSLSLSYLCCNLWHRTQKLELEGYGYRVSRWWVPKIEVERNGSCYQKGGRVWLSARPRQQQQKGEWVYGFFCLVLEHQGNNTSELYVNGVSLISSTSLKQDADKNKISPNLSNYIFFQMLRRDEKRCFRYGIIALCSIFFLFAIYSPVYQPSSQREGEFLNPSYFGNVVYTLLALVEN